MTYNNILGMFRSLRTILCICPHCEAIQRVSDLQIKYGGRTGKTWLDDYEADALKQSKREAEFEEQEKDLRDQARERGRQQVPSILKNLIHSELTTLPFDPYDIKAVLHPVDFVVFDGMNLQDKLKDIVFLSRRPDSRTLGELKGSIKTAIYKGSYDWRVARVDINGAVTYGAK